MPLTLNNATKFLESLQAIFPDSFPFVYRLKLTWQPTATPPPLPTPLKTTFKVNHITQPFLIQVKAIKTNISIKSPANSSGTASVYIKFLLVLCDILACRSSGLWYWHIESNFNLHYTLPILFAVFCVFLFHNMKGVSMPWLLRLISKTSVQNSSMN